MLYLLKLGIGWAIGMLLAVVILSSLFDSQIYIVTSLFIGFIAGAIPLIIIEEKVRVQSLYAILGMMIGSFYAIIQGPATLDLPKEAMNFSNFNFIACVIGLLLVIGMYKIKERSKKNGI